MYCIQENDSENLKKLKVGSKNVNFLMEFPDNDLDKSLSPLMLAAALGHEECLKMLLDNPTIDVDIPSENKRYTALAFACLTGNYDIAKMLLEKDPEVNRPTRLNETPLVLSLNRLKQEKNLFENRKIAFKIADLLLVYGADINWIVDKTKGYTLLMQLCAENTRMTEHQKEANLEAIKFLIDRGANREIRCMENKTYLELAEQNPNYEEIVSHVKSINGTGSPGLSARHRSRARSVSVDKKKIQLELDKERKKCETVSKLK